MALALLILIDSAAEASHTTAIALFYSSLSWALFVLVYYFLNRQITKRQQLEANFQELYNNAPCGYHSLDRNATFIAINDTELSWLGYSRDEVIGKLKFTDLLTPETLVTFQENFPRFLEQGWVKDLEFQLIRKDGTILPVLLNATTIKDEAGNFVVTRSTIFDINERKQAEEALRESEARLRLALEAAHMGNWDWNILTNQVTWSSGQEQLFGLSTGTFGGTYEAFEACVYPEDRESIIQALNKARLEQRDYHQEFRIVWPDGSIHWIEAKGKFLYDRTGQAVRMLGTMMDISDAYRQAAQRQLAETELQQSEQKFRQLAENIDEVFWMSDVATNETLYVSSTYEQVWGRSCESLYANLQLFLDSIHPEDKQRVIANLEQNATKTFDIEYRIVRPDASVRWIQDRAFPIRNEYGEIYRRAGIAKDITQRKQAEAILQQVKEELEIRVAERTAELTQANDRLQRELFERERVERALRQSEERWQLAIQGSNDGIWDLNVKTNEVFYSVRWKEMLGYEDHEIGNHIDEWVKRVHPDDLEQVKQVYQDHLTRKTPFYTNEHRLMCKNGTYKWILTRGQARWDEEGTPLRVTGSHTDISDRKQAEEALRESEERFRSAFDYASIGMALVGLDGRWLKVNPAMSEILGYSEQEFLELTFQAITHPDDLQTNLNYAQQLLRGEIRSYEMQKRYFHKLGHEVWTLLSVSLMRDTNSQPLYFISQVQDISDAYSELRLRKQAEAALRQAYDELELRVQERTLALFKANEELQIENAERKRIEAELKTRAKQQAAVAELGQQALAGNRLDRLMNQAVTLIAQTLEVEYCNVLELLPVKISDRLQASVVLLEEGTASLKPSDHHVLDKAVLLRAGVGWQEGLVGHATITIGLDSQVGYTLISSEPVVVEDLRTEIRFKSSPLLHEHGVVSGLSVIIPAHNRPYGVLGAHTTRQRKFTKDDVHFLQATANVLATAINRQQVEEALRRAHDELEIRVQERTVDLEKANLELQQKIIERQQTEEERTQLIAILEATPDIIATTTVDEQTLYLNSAARKVFGFGENEDSTNFTILNAHPTWASELVRNEGIPTAMREGVWVGETAFLSHQGQEIPVSQLIIAHQSPDGSIKMLSTIARNITQHKQIAATLLEAERRWRSLLENVRLVVVGLDNDGKIDYVNSYFLELVGYTKAEILGKDWFKTFVALPLVQEGQKKYREVLEQEFYTHNQNVLLTKSGEERVIAWNNTRLKDSHGNIIGTLSIGEDITERQVIERMKDEFISVVSHELRTPLTAIHGALNLLSSGLVNTQSDRGRRVIEIAAESAERLVRLVNDILELERLESGKISLLKQICNVADLMMKATDLIQVMANRAGITLVVSPQTIHLNADPDRIIQILTNLLGNAIKFSPNNSTIWLTVERQEAGESGNNATVFQGKALLSSEDTENTGFSLDQTDQSLTPTPTVLFKVKDQGRGIPEDKIESIFERFHQVDASDSRKKGGTGLGLAICRSIIQQHGGRIWVESTLGEGSCFYFTLPGL